MIRININRQSLLMAVLLSYNSIMVYFTAIFNRLPIINAVGEYVIPFFAIMLFIWCLLNGDFKETRTSDITLIVVFLISLLFSYLLYPQNQPYYQYNMNAVFFNAIPWFLIGINFKMEKQSFDFLTVVSCAAVIINFFYLFYFVNTREFTQDSMYWSYNILPHALIIICSVFKRHSLRHKVALIICSVISALYIVFMGTRGPVLIFLIAFAIMFIRAENSKKKKILSILALVLLVLFIESNYFVDLVIFLRAKSLSMGFSTRVFDLFLQGEYINHTSGRDVIFDTLMNKIAERPILGYGIFGEWQFVNYTAHNIFLELCMHYGIIIGSVIALSSIITEIKGYLVSKNEYAKDFIFLFFVFTWVRSIFGGDYLSFYFCFLLGLSIQEIRTRRKMLE